MTARFRSVFAGSSGFVAANPLARMVPATHLPSGPATPANKPVPHPGATAHHVARAG